jgi:hypothetical protein
MAVQPHQVQTVFFHGGQRGRQFGVPDAVFAVFTAGVGLVAVAVAKAGVDAQPDAVAFGACPKLAQHVDGAGIDGDAVLHHGVQRGVVKQVGRENDAGGALGVGRCCEACRQCALDFAA